MSFFTKWNPKKKSLTPNKGKEKENTGKNGKSTDFEDEHDLDLPASVRRPERNMSISRSGRHKMRQRQRTSVMNDELYSPTTGEPRQQAQTAHMTWQPCDNATSAPSTHAHTQSGMPSGGSTGYHCRETVDSNAGRGSLSGSQRMAHAPTAV